MMMEFCKNISYGQRSDEKNLGLDQASARGRIFRYSLSFLLKGHLPKSNKVGQWIDQFYELSLTEHLLRYPLNVKTLGKVANELKETVKK